MKLSEHALIQLMIISLAAVPFSAAGEYARHKAHVHGIAELTLALEGDKLEAMFTSPAMSLVGFEHKTTNREQIAAAAKVAAALGDAKALFIFEGANCVADDIEIDMSAITGNIEQEQHSNHGSHDAHDKRDEQNSHADISAHYSYTCSQIDHLQSLRFGAGKLPFNLEEVNVMWVSDRGQGASTLTHDNQLIEFN